MKKLTAQQIRMMWLDFYKSKGHHIEQGASLIPKNDPTLLWINAGVAALKKYFDGSDIPPSRRITNVQKCIRTNDIENVGHTARHHTFFEMLGNFSIGDYFRKEVIPWAYELLTDENWAGFDKDKLYITYFTNDLETKKTWMECGIEESHLIPQEENFWDIGAGPCGPDTEIFFDRGERFDPNHIGINLLKNDIENDRYIEIWNIVFSQFNHEEGKTREEYKELPSKNIDTGGGLERWACIMQETDSNFETDLFLPIIQSIQHDTNKKYDDNHLAFRVIADHIRSVTFALADGEMFSNEGRGYVVRRLLRRAERYGKVLGFKEPFLYHYVDLVIDIMKDFYPYLEGKKDFIKKTIKSEEEKFLKTLANGENVLNKCIEGKEQLLATDMFRLYDTFGFPKELTLEICQEKNVKVDMDGFLKLMKEQKERARNARGNVQSMNKQSIDLMNFTAESLFNYQNLPIFTEVIGLFKDGVKVDFIDEYGDIILKETNFYAESGGQIFDIGTLENDDFAGNVISVNKAPNKQHLHHVNVNFGEIHVGDKVEAKIDVARRMSITRNHSSVHLLQKALSEVLGDHIAQHGSYVNDEYSHFDFNHFEKLTPVQLLEVEKKVNTWISKSIPCETMVLKKEEAEKLGAKALFDEKYGDTVRVVCFDDVSREFCGGTHVSNSSDIGLFVIEYEESVAAGIRRIQAKTSLKAYELIKRREAILDRLKEGLHVSSYFDMPSRLSSLIDEKDCYKKLSSSLADKIASMNSSSLKNEFVEINGLHVLIKYLKDHSRKDLITLIDNLKQSYDDYVIILIGDDGSGLPITVSISEPGIKNGYKAGELVKNIATVLNGSGGGRPDMASGAGKDKNKIDEALKKAKELLNA